VCETCRLLGSAIEDGRIEARSVETWKRAFETAPELAREVLANQRPDLHTRMENRRALVARPFSEEDDTVYRAYISQVLGVRPEDVI
jgi:hypothetical protein